MYFWQIEKLKSDMASRPLSERETLPYVVISAVVVAAISYIPLIGFNVWDGLGATWSVILAALGTIHIYRQNGGNDGSQFLQRFVVIGFVVAVRWGVAMVLVIAFLFLGLALASVEIEESTTWYDFAILGVAETVLYLRIAHHVREVGRKAVAQQGVGP